MKTRDEAVTLAKEIEHEMRFTCEVFNWGTRRQPKWSINVTDSHRQEENGVGNWYYAHWAVNSRDFWTLSRQKIRDFESQRIASPYA